MINPLRLYAIKFYKYYFFEVKKPVVIEARTAESAREKLKTVYETLPEPWHSSKIIGESVTSPIDFISTKKQNGTLLTWVGEDEENSTNGWSQI